MRLRTAPIVSWPLAHQGAILDVAEISLRCTAFRAALMADRPCLQQLQAAEVVQQVEITPRGMAWNATRRESTQMGLRLFVYGAAALDPFQQELNLVRRTQKRLPQEYRAAPSDAHEPAANTRVSVLRQHMRRDGCGRQLQIVAHADQCELLHPEHLPHQMPLAELCEVHARVLNIIRTRALVKLANAVTLPISNTTMPAGTKLQLLRGHRFTSVDAGHRLQLAMDTRLIVRLLAAVTQRWDDGTFSALELHGLPDH
ncbi:hypothetical protein [Hydrogenophaga sp.]|uniref:hypothetical protein n=1 Tax=Hydrogenophaga sp. TaxID=1904254 RepID=UPI003F6BD803